MHLHFFVSSAGGGGGVGGGGGGGGGGAAGGTPLSMQLLHLLSTQPSISFSPSPPKCLPPQSLAMIPAITPTMVITARTTTSVSMDLCEYRLGGCSSPRCGVSTTGVNWSFKLTFNVPITINKTMNLPSK